MVEPEIKRVDTKVVYKNRWMTVREDRVKRPNGDQGLFGVVEKPDFSLIIPFDGENFHLVEQYRYPVDGRYWEFPQGSLELSSDTTTPEEIAAVELAEERSIARFLGRHPDGVRLHREREISNPTSRRI